MDEDRLAEIAAQLAGRVRDDDPEANGRWLAAMVPDPRDWWRLCFILAAAVRDDVPFTTQTAWALLQPCGTASALRRHQSRGEPVCEACRAYDRNRKRAARVARKLSTGLSTGEAAA